MLGNYVAVQVRAVDYLAAAMTIGLGAFAVADVTYLNIYEPTAEIGTLRSVGWGDRDVRWLFGLEGILTAVVGASAGALIAIIATAILLPVSPTVSTIAALVSAAAGILAAAIALLVPLTRVSRLAPATALSSE